MKLNLTFEKLSILAIIISCCTVFFLMIENVNVKFQNVGNEIDSHDVKNNIINSNFSGISKTIKAQKFDIKIEKNFPEILSTSAKTQNLQLISINSSQVSSPPTHQAATQLNIAFKGTYNAQKQWLSEALAKYPRLAVQHLTLSLSDSASDQVTLSARLVIFPNEP